MLYAVLQYSVPVNGAMETWCNSGKIYVFSLLSNVCRLA